MREVAAIMLGLSGILPSLQIASKIILPERQAGVKLRVRLYYVFAVRHRRRRRRQPSSRAVVLSFAPPMSTGAAQRPPSLVPSLLNLARDVAVR
jgi:hypothetical protein